MKTLRLQLVTLLCCLSTPAMAEPFQSLSAVIATVNEYLLNKDEIKNHPDTQIHIHPIDKRLKLQQCNQLETRLSPGARLIGKTSVQVICKSPKPWQFYVNATISRFENVYAMSASFARGHIIRQDDIYEIKKDLSRLPFGYISQSSDVVGKELKRNIQAGSVITPTMLRKPLVIKRGEIVAIKHRATGFSVQMNGTAMSNGAVGDRIRVKNNSSKRIIEGTVARSGLVYTE